MMAIFPAFMIAIRSLTSLLLPCYGLKKNGRTHGFTQIEMLPNALPRDGSSPVVGSSRKNFRAMKHRLSDFHFTNHPARKSSDK